MAFSGIGKLIKDLVTGTPVDTDYFAFGNTDLKKISFANLRKALGIDALNSALTNKSNINHSHAWTAITNKPTSFQPTTHNHDDRYFTESEINSKITTINNTIKNKIISKSGNIKFTNGGNNESYGYINIPSGCEMLAVYMQEVSGNVKLRCKGFNKNAGTGGYTVWLDFAINDNVFMHWIYVTL